MWKVRSLGRKSEVRKMRCMEGYLRTGGWAVLSCVRGSIRVKGPGASFYRTRNPTVIAE